MYNLNRKKVLMVGKSWVTVGKCPTMPTPSYAYAPGRSLSGFRNLKDQRIFCLPFSNSSNTHQYSIYSRADWDRMLEFLTHYNFNPMYNLTDINLKSQFIKDVLHDAPSWFVLISKPKSHCRPEWFNFEVQHKLNCIHTIRRKTKARPTPHNTAKLKAAEESLSLTMEMQNTFMKPH